MMDKLNVVPIFVEHIRERYNSASDKYKVERGSKRGGTGAVCVYLSGIGGCSKEVTFK